MAATTMRSFIVVCKFSNTMMLENPPKNCAVVNVFLCATGKLYSCVYEFKDQTINPDNLQGKVSNGYFHVENDKLYIFVPNGTKMETLVLGDKLPDTSFVKPLTREFNRETVAKFFMPSYENVDQLRESIYWKYIMAGLDLAKGVDDNMMLELVPDGLLLFNNNERCDDINNVSLDYKSMPLLFRNKNIEGNTHLFDSFAAGGSYDVLHENSNPYYSSLSELDEKTFFNRNTTSMFCSKFIRVHQDGNIYMQRVLNLQIMAFYHALAIGFICLNPNEFKESMNRDVVLDISTYNGVLSAELHRGSKKLPQVGQVAYNIVYNTKTHGYTLAVPIYFQITVDGNDRCGKPFV